ncbi:MAG: hypothetical protein SFV51_17390 [Bryobacteraceae bacterium]|nr:hypothetical protein [Bryobacteraceae bacterium]
MPETTASRTTISYNIIGSGDLKLQVNVGPETFAAENELIPGRLVKFLWRLVRFHRQLVEEHQESFTDFAADQPEMVAQLIGESGFAYLKSKFDLPFRQPDDSVRRALSQVSLLLDTAFCFGEYWAK